MANADWVLSGLNPSKFDPDLLAGWINSRGGVAPALLGVGG